MSHKSITLLLPALLLVLAACEADDAHDDVTMDAEPIPTEEATPTEEPEPTVTPEPEPTATPIQQEESDAGAEHEDDVTDAGATEDDDAIDQESGFDDQPIEGADDPFGTIPAVHLEEFRDADLSTALLEAGHLPDGWEVMTDGSLPEDAEASQSLGDMMAGPCDTEVLSLEALGNPTHVGRYFMGPDWGPFFNQDIFAFDDEDAATEAMELAKAQLECEDWTAPDPDMGIDMDYTVEALDFPELGDETVAVRLSIEPASGAGAGAQPVQFEDFFDDLGAEAVLVRQGDTLSSFTHLRWFGQSDLNLEEIITLATERVENVR